MGNLETDLDGVGDWTRGITQGASCTHGLCGDARFVRLVGRGGGGGETSYTWWIPRRKTHHTNGEKRERGAGLDGR